MYFHGLLFLKAEKFLMKQKKGNSMARFFRSFVFRNLVASTSLISFSLSTVPYAHAEISEKQYIVGELLFLNNIKKITEKLQKHINKGETDQAINKMFDIKKEIELYSNIKLSTSDKLEDAKKRN